MKNLRDALDLWWHHVVVLADGNQKLKSTVAPKTLLRWTHNQTKFGEIIVIGKVSWCCARKVLFHLLYFFHKQLVSAERGRVWISQDASQYRKVESSQQSDGKRKVNKPTNLMEIRFWVLPSLVFFRVRVIMIAKLLYCYHTIDLDIIGLS